MARLDAATLLLVGLCATLAVEVAVGADNKTETPENDSSDDYDDDVDEDGEEVEVANPADDPSETDNFDDTKEDWQPEILKGLLLQRKTETDFINNLEIGGKNLDAMVQNISSAFNKLEADRQRKGLAIIKRHFNNEMDALREAQKNLKSKLTSLLEVNDKDSAETKSLKSKVQTILNAHFQTQIENQKKLSQKEFAEMESEHKKQQRDVQSVYSLVQKWRNSFHDGIEQSKQQLKKIMEKWDML